MQNDAGSISKVDGKSINALSNIGLDLAALVFNRPLVYLVYFKLNFGVHQGGVMLSAPFPQVLMMTSL